jgi:hypothetical protein
MLHKNVVFVKGIDLDAAEKRCFAKGTDLSVPSEPQNQLGFSP